MKFASRFAKQRIVIEPIRQLRDASGFVVDMTPGKEIQFEGHVYATDDALWLSFAR